LARLTKVLSLLLEQCLLALTLRREVSVLRQCRNDIRETSVPLRLRRLPIGEGQTISHPYTVAFQTEQLNIIAGEKVLEIGTGCGYQTAVLSEMGAKVFSVERQKVLFQKTKIFLPQLGYHTAKLFYGDGYKGLVQFAPFDKIIVTAGAPYIPNDLLIQLKIGGIMIIPIGEGVSQEMIWLKKTSQTTFDKKTMGIFNFVPLLQNKSG
jgi:protein-L-isoaspartate(D-aspartate) O-methyltransferase